MTATCELRGRVVLAVYDCFTFYNEYALLEWRFKMLYSLVDVFVIVEGNRTFQNKPKGLNFPKYRRLFAPYEKKIRYVAIEEEMPYNSDWSIEIFQRNYIKKALAGCKEDDVIILSDADEIVDPQLLRCLNDGGGKVHLFSTFERVEEREGVRGLSRNLRCFLRALPHMDKRASLREFLRCGPVVCEQEMYNFFVNYQKDSNWCGSIFVQYGQIETMQSLRARRNKYPMVRGGWHFSSLGGWKNVLNKIYSTSDGKCDPIYGLDETEQKRVIEEGLGKGYLWWRDEYLKKREIADLQIPFVEWFVKKYPDMYHA